MQSYSYTTPKAESCALLLCKMYLLHYTNMTLGFDAIWNWDLDLIPFKIGILGFQDPQAP